ncbi:MULTISPECIES: hypothetical protein [unclassified Mesorhizobium]|uniref:hypothetical protein n=1 Tax=unclassified Mesorhizobium TaxID=325217 RepID=UPI0003CE43DC|nr:MULTISPECIES: hypothetical protein [unclassified Mesorhizobium]ESY09658.1 hypothetical protein X751_31380 [Mesorhizobium sp. LNJC395A00]WJI76706.1 hypothetical protein NLY37_08380 [Mesorhizobium sp. C395A]
MIGAVIALAFACQNSQALEGNARNSLKCWKEGPTLEYSQLVGSSVSEETATPSIADSPISLIQPDSEVARSNTLWISVAGVMVLPADTSLGATGRPANEAPQGLSRALDSRRTAELQEAIDSSLLITASGLLAHQRPRPVFEDLSGEEEFSARQLAEVLRDGPTARVKAGFDREAFLRDLQLPVNQKCLLANAKAFESPFQNRKVEAYNFQNDPMGFNGLFGTMANGSALPLTIRVFGGNECPTCERVNPVELAETFQRVDPIELDIVLRALPNPQVPAPADDDPPAEFLVKLQQYAETDRAKACASSFVPNQSASTILEVAATMWLIYINNCFTVIDPSSLSGSLKKAHLEHDQKLLTAVMKRVVSFDFPAPTHPPSEVCNKIVRRLCIKPNPCHGYLMYHDGNLTITTARHCLFANDFLRTETVAVMPSDINGILLSGEELRGKLCDSSYEFAKAYDTAADIAEIRLCSLFIAGAEIQSQQWKAYDDAQDTPKFGDQLLVIAKSRDLTKIGADKRIVVMDDSPTCALFAISGSNLFHNCQTIGGVSGAPIFKVQTDGTKVKGYTFIGVHDGFSTEVLGTRDLGRLKLWANFGTFHVRKS